MNNPDDAGPEDEGEEVRLNIRMPDQLRRRLKVMAAMEDKPMAQKVREWIRERWDDYQGKAAVV